MDYGHEDETVLSDLWKTLWQFDRSRICLTQNNGVFIFKFIDDSGDHFEVTVGVAVLI
jgi:hypothetical protein